MKTCDLCGAPATKWNGGEQAYYVRKGGRLEKATDD